MKKTDNKKKKEANTETERKQLEEWNKERQINTNSERWREEWHEENNKDRMQREKKVKTHTNRMN